MKQETSYLTATLLGVVLAVGVMMLPQANARGQHDMSRETGAASGTYDQHAPLAAGNYVYTFFNQIFDKNGRCVDSYSTSFTWRDNDIEAAAIASNGAEARARSKYGSNWSSTHTQLTGKQPN
jgi:hypothetical protein